MLKLSKMTDYAAVVMAYIARHHQQQFTAAELSEQVGVPKPTVSKLLKMLVRAGLVESRRGAQGGYVLSRPAGHITVADLIEAIEGPVAMTDCSHTENQCDLAGQCGVADNWQRVTVAVHQMLSSVTLAHLAQETPIRLPLVQIQAVNLMPDLAKA